MSIRPLFTSGNLWNQLTTQEREALEAVKDIAPDVVLATPEADLVGQLYHKFWIEPLELHPERRYSPTGVAATKFEVKRRVP